MTRPEELLSGPYVAGYDGSPSSQAAVELAARLGQAAGADVVAASVYPFSPAAYWIAVETVQFDQIEADLRRAAEDVVEGLDVPGVDKRVVKADSPTRGLHDLAESLGAGLVAVGVTHRGALGRLAAGSVGMHLLHGAPCPVLVTPPDSGQTELGTIGVAYDGRSESKAALEVAKVLAERQEARIVVLGALEPITYAVPMAGVMPANFLEENEEKFENALREAAASCGGSADYRKLTGPAARTLADASAEVDLLVTGSRGYGAVAGVLLGSVSRHLVDHAECPVLVVPQPG